MSDYDDISPGASRAELERAEALGETIADAVVGLWSGLKRPVTALAGLVQTLRGGPRPEQPLAPTSDVLTDGGHA